MLTSSKSRPMLTSPSIRASFLLMATKRRIWPPKLRPESDFWSNLPKSKTTFREQWICKRTLYLLCSGGPNGLQWFRGSNLRLMISSLALKISHPVAGAYPVFASERRLEFATVPARSWRPGPVMQVLKSHFITSVAVASWIINFGAQSNPIMSNLKTLLKIL